MDFKNYIRDIKDFPKKGIIYKDISPLLANIDVMKAAADALFEGLQHQKIDKVVGIESRGFFMATLLAERLNAGFVPIRKPGKLPYKVYTETYDLEYGTNQLEIHQDAILPGENVLLHDDVLATGGTAEAAIKLIRKLGGNLIESNFLIELEFLNGREKIKTSAVQSLMKF
ncbi:adenine phosphoribosyltransferase [Psychroflexus salis]|uniref:Adenine phosphoribosyltransferase n=1 Tax=Psychroflexus salis TaxID=1526574 RepID=A0A917A3B1_9FLAO|nr:adenine phosphoribosyltransferase [Psychroflexus salis]GGE22013.1 adenine phosphoribosyltransferase [Psychroflexus salis]